MNINLSTKTKMGFKLSLIGIITLCIPGLNLLIYLMILLPLGSVLGLKMKNESNGGSLILIGLVYLTLWFLIGYLFGKRKENYEKKA